MAHKCMPVCVYTYKHVYKHVHIPQRIIIAIKCLRTRSAAVRHWRDLSLISYEQDLVTNEKV